MTSLLKMNLLFPLNLILLLTQQSSCKSSSGSTNSSNTSDSSEPPSSHKYDRIELGSIHNIGSKAKNKFRKVRFDEDIRSSKARPSRKKTRKLLKKLKKASVLRSLSAQKSFESPTLANSLICNQNQRKPTLPGGPQKIGFTYSQAWQQKTEESFRKRKRNQSSSKPIMVDDLMNGFDQKFADDAAGIVKNPINAGWWLVPFTTAKSTAATSFQFKNSRRIAVHVVDLFCRGDSYGVVDGETLVAQTSRVRADLQCSELAFSPQQALQDGRWSAVVFDLDPGLHKISLKVIDSPLKGGLAAIKFEEIPTSGGTHYADRNEGSDEEVDPTRNQLPTTEDLSSNDDESDSHPKRTFSRDKVCRGYNGFLVILEPFTLENAGAACQSIKTSIADLSDKDALAAAAKSVYSCLKSNTSVWVDALEQDGRADLVLKAGKSGTSESLTQPSSFMHPVLCQYKHEQ